MDTVSRGASVRDEGAQAVATESGSDPATAPPPALTDHELQVLRRVAEAVAETPCSSFPRRRESILHIWSGLDSRLRGNDENGAIKGLRNSLGGAG